MTTIIIQYWGKVEWRRRERRESRRSVWRRMARPYITWEFLWALSTKEEINLLCLPQPLPPLSPLLLTLLYCIIAHPCCGRQLNMLAMRFPCHVPASVSHSLHLLHSISGSVCRYAAALCMKSRMCCNFAKQSLAEDTHNLRGPF